MDLLHLTIVGLQLCLYVSLTSIIFFDSSEGQQSSPTPTPTGPLTLPLINQTIIYTFSTPDSLTATPSTGCTSCGECGFCLKRLGSCFCYDGCSYSPTTNKCDDRNECAVWQCYNGGSCTNEVGYYHCQCPPGFAGRDCEYKHDGTRKPVVDGISRNRGIQAGGGEVEIIGKNFDLFPPVKVFFIPNEATSMRGGIKRSKFSTSERFSIITPMVPQNFIGLPFIMQVIFAGNHAIDISRNFTYTENPTVTGVRPFTPLVTIKGGARLTINGTDLDVPSKTVIIAALRASNQSDIFHGESTCQSKGSAIAHCPMPLFGIDSAWIENSEIINGTMEVRLKHDAFLDDTPQVLEPSFIAPVIISTEAIEYYDPERGESLKIPAEKVNTASTSMEDYLIEIGNKNCTMISMVSNLLECLPPKSTPLVLKNSIPKCNADGTAVFVTVYGEPQFSKCVRYYNSRLPLIIGLSIASILIASLVLGLLFTMRKQIKCPIVPRPNDPRTPRQAYGDTTDQQVHNNRACSAFDEIREVYDVPHQEEIELIQVIEMSNGDL